MIAQERAPALTARGTIVGHVLGHRGLCHREPKLEQLAVNARCTCGSQDDNGRWNGCRDKIRFRCLSAEGAGKPTSPRPTLTTRSTSQRRRIAVTPKKMIDVSRRVALEVTSSSNPMMEGPWCRVRREARARERRRHWNWWIA